MRAYFFGNMYLSSIQQGIQSGHVIAEMFVKYPYEEELLVTQVLPFEFLYTWARDHKTMILLNGGYSETLHELYDFFCSENNPFPFAKFHEGRDALDGALTSVGIILPARIYDEFNPTLPAFSAPDMISVPVFTDWELELISRVKAFGLAR